MEVMAEAVQAVVMRVAAHRVAMRAHRRAATLPRRVAMVAQAVRVAVQLTAVLLVRAVEAAPVATQDRILTTVLQTLRQEMVALAVMVEAPMMRVPVGLVVKVPMVVLRMQKLIQAMQQQMAVRAATVATAVRQQAAATTAV